MIHDRSEHWHDDELLKVESRVAGEPDYGLVYTAFDGVLDLVFLPGGKMSSLTDFARAGYKFKLPKSIRNSDKRRKK